MSIAEILVLCLFAFIVLCFLFNYILHGRKVNTKQKAEKKKEDTKQEEKSAPTIEQKPVPVGIIKEKIVKAEDNIAPFKEIVENEEQSTNEKKTKETTIQEEIKSLSSEMKKVLISDILKPRF